VRSDTPTSSLSTTGHSTPPIDDRPERCAVTNARTSAGRTSSGCLSITVKNTFRSTAAASTVFGRHRPDTNLK
jgi:hypothetical protein